MKSLIFISSFLLSACATMTPDVCKNADWEKVGQVDGGQGRPAITKESHRQTCQGVADVDGEAYMRGWQVGQSKYCQPENAFQIGRNGEPLQEICSEKSMKTLRESHSRGWALNIKEQEKKQVESEIDKERERIQKDKSVVNHVAQTYNLITGRSPTEALDNKRVTLTDEINALDVNAPNTSTTPAFVHKKNQDLMISGAALGSFLGFGLGHAVQGRYKESGWKWTVGEVGLIGSMIAAAQTSECVGRTPEQGCSNPWSAVTGLSWLAFRVWQGYDLFHYALTSEYQSAVLMTPQGLAWVREF